MAAALAAWVASWVTAARMRGSRPARLVDACQCAAETLWGLVVAGVGWTWRWTGRGPRGLGMAMFPTSAQQAWDQAVRVRAHSRRLRKQVAEVEEQCAAIHDAMAAHAGPVVGAAERTARARRCRSGGTATARAYRLGVAPPVVA